MNWKSLLFLLVWTGSTVPSAHASRPAMDPLNRLHAGYSYTDGSGVGMGLDSRMTNLIWMDVGAFMTTSDLKDIDIDGWTLRHSIYLAPGFRLPHQQPERIQWDLFARGGFSGVWAADTAANYSQVINMGLFTGGEFMVKSGNVGIRLSGKVFYFKPWSKTDDVEVSLIRPQYGAEAIYQF